MICILSRLFYVQDLGILLKFLLVLLVVSWLTINSISLALEICSALDAWEALTDIEGSTGGTHHVVNISIDLQTSDTSLQCLQSDDHLLRDRRSAFRKTTDIHHGCETNSSRYFDDPRCLSVH